MRLSNPAERFATKMTSEAQPGLNGATVIVTGAARGQGAAEAQVLCDSGASVLVADVLDEQGESLAAELRQAGATAEFRHLDVTSQDDWEAAVSWVVETWGGIDALVNNAGIADRARLGDLDPEVFSRMVDVNAYGAVLGTNNVTAAMAARRQGSIVNVASIAGQTAWPAAGYAMSKWAMTGLTKIAALELGSLGIRVNSVHPGLIETDMASGLSDVVRDRFTRATPLGRTGTANDVAWLVAFLCSSKSSYLSGAEISVDGGFTAAGASHSVFANLAPDKR